MPMPPPPPCETFYSLNEQHTIFRWRKGANLKNFQDLGHKNHGWKAHFVEICLYQSILDGHDNVVSILGVTHCDPSPLFEKSWLQPCIMQVFTISESWFRRKQFSNVNAILASCNSAIKKITNKQKACSKTYRCKKLECR